MSKKFGNGDLKQCYLNWISFFREGLPSLFNSFYPETFCSSCSIQNLKICTECQICIGCCLVGGYHSAPQGPTGFQGWQGYIPGPTINTIVQGIQGVQGPTEFAAAPPLSYHGVQGPVGR